MPALRWCVPRDPLPYATPDVPGIGGVLRSEPADFFVQELPLIDPSGEGGHVWFEAQKVDLTTPEAVRRIGRALGVSPRDVGQAGLKDRRAVARQLFSVPLDSPDAEERVMRMEVDGLAPQWAARHDKKLRMGQLLGNRFAVRVREVDPAAVVRLRPLLDRLIRDGLPNYFGEQRFGRDDRRPNDALGLLLLRRDVRGFCDLYLGGDDGREDVAAARAMYDAGDVQAAAAAWPRNIRPELKVIQTLAKTGDPKLAAGKVDSRIRRLWESAAQSSVFNRVVADRLADGLLSTPVAGDVAVRHDDDLRSGGPFVLDDPADADYPAWKQSPTGPLPGGKMYPRPTRDAADRESAALSALGLADDDFVRLPGVRRPLRVRPVDTRLSAGVDENGPHVVVAFTLPAGSFATTLMRELMK